MQSEAHSILPSSNCVILNPDVKHDSVDRFLDDLRSNSMFIPP